MGDILAGLVVVSILLVAIIGIMLVEGYLITRRIFKQKERDGNQ